MIAPKPRKLTSYFQERLSAGRKAVTIGIGMLCTDGVLVCADRQHTSPRAGFKFEAVKTSRHIARNCRLSFCYSGNQDDATAMLRIIYDTFDDVFESEPEANGPINRTLRALTKIFKDKTAKYLEMLIGVCFPGSACGLIKTSGNRVVVGVTEYIGCGDSSVLRYLADILLPNWVPSTHEADFLSCYMCSVATRYIDGCGGGPDRIVLHLDGVITDAQGGPLDNQRERNLYSEAETGKVLRELIYSGGTKVAFTRSTSQTTEDQQ
jgi:hypothetical protein